VLELQSGHAKSGCKIGEQTDNKALSSEIRRENPNSSAAAYQTENLRCNQDSSAAIEKLFQQMPSTIGNIHITPNKLIQTKFLIMTKTNNNITPILSFFKINAVTKIIEASQKNKTIIE
jgi:hypothetical protein